MNISHLLAFSSVLISSALAQVEAPVTNQESQKWAFIAAPVYSAETSWRLAAVLNRAIDPMQVGDKPSDIDFTFEYSLKNQFRLGLVPSVFLAGNTWHLKADLEAIRWPTDYFGIGAGAHDSISYDALGFRGKWQVERSFLEQKGWVGIHAITNFENIDFDASIPEKAGVLDSTAYKSYQKMRVNPPVGLTQNRSVGLGLFASFDTRDHINWPRTGTLVSAEVRTQPEFLGSATSYNTTQFNLSQFFPGPFGSALAFNGIHDANFGDVPFREMAMPDGSHQLRGLKNGRYRDKQMLSGSAEWRVPSPFTGFLGKFGLTTFAEQAQVAPDLNSFKQENWVGAYGIGLRFALNEARKYNARIDIAQVDEHMSFLVSVREAF